MKEKKQEQKPKVIEFNSVEEMISFFMGKISDAIKFEKSKQQFKEEPKRFMFSSIEDLENLQEELRTCFVWTGSPQGGDYWCSVVDELQKLIDLAKQQKEGEKRD